ncbi:hypothetical protein LWI29_026117 [Acer saccharum]|uniref:Cux N-terminal domain-containing protein n=1 Tax=Acer saccharum TaxID=4024 RepID=A0AA39S384_ACESA|nr:hypothetical protein LWI29_026117 [Acer saccharum]
MEAPQGGSDRDKSTSSSGSSLVPVFASFPKDFEQASAEEKLILLESLLEGYQEEVDNLTKRAEFGENAFLEIYQKLYEGLGHYAALDSVAGYCPVKITSDIMKDLNDEEKILPELYVDLHKIHTTLSNEQEKHGSEIKKLNTLLDEKEAVLEETKEALRTSQARLVNQLRHEKLKSLVFGKTVSVLLEKKRKLKDEPNQLEEAVLEEIKKALQNSPTAKLVNDMRQEKQKSLVLGRAVPILLEKNRILKDASTQLEVKLLEKTSSLETAEGNIAELTAKVIEKQKLIQKLKEDVLKYARDVETLNLDIESKFKKKYEDEVIKRPYLLYIEIILLKL